MGLFDKAAKLADAVLERQLRQQARDLHAKILSMGSNPDRMKQGMAVFVDEFCALTGSGLDYTIVEVKEHAQKLRETRLAKKGLKR